MGGTDTQLDNLKTWLPASDRTTRRTARPWSTSRSTWSCTPATSTCPWLTTSTEMISLMPASPPSSRRTPNRRGGKVVFQDIAKPTTMEWGTPLEAMEAALELEKTVNQSLLDMHKGADGDAHLCDFLEANFLDEQVDAIKEISGWITKLKRTGPGVGFHLIDKDISG